MLRKVMGQNTGSGGGSVGRAVAYDARGPRFESSHRQTFISDIYLFIVKNFIEKTNINKKRQGMAFLKTSAGFEPSHKSIAITQKAPQSYH